MLGEGCIFSNPSEIRRALINDALNDLAIIGIDTNYYNQKPNLAAHQNGILITTPSKVLFNECLPPQFNYVNGFDGKNTVFPADILEAGVNLTDAIAARTSPKPINKTALSFIVAKINEELPDDYDSLDGCKAK
jgi:DNA-directed RNA polymerase subunit beta'